MAEPTGGDPVQEGMDAFARSVRREECPYPEGSEQRQRWLKGWDERAELEKKAEPGVE